MSAPDEERFERAKAAAYGLLLRNLGPCLSCGADNAALYLDADHRPADLDALDVPIGVTETVDGVVRCSACEAGNGFLSYGDTP